MTANSPDHRPEEDYHVSAHREVSRFLRTHPDLGERWEEIVAQIRLSPRFGPHIDHLKGLWLCSFRWDKGSYRIKYDVDDKEREIYFYGANNRGDAYRGRGGDSLIPNPPKGGRRVSDLKPQEGAPDHHG